MVTDCVSVRTYTYTHTQTIDVLKQRHIHAHKLISSHLHSKHLFTQMTKTFPHSSLVGSVGPRSYFQPHLSRFEKLSLSSLPVPQHNRGVWEFVRDAHSIEKLHSDLFFFLLKKQLLLKIDDILSEIMEARIVGKTHCF